MKTTLIICAVLFASFSFTNCGGKKEEAKGGEAKADSTAQGPGETTTETTETAATTEDSTAAAKTEAPATEAKK